MTTACTGGGRLAPKGRDDDGEDPEEQDDADGYTSARKYPVHLPPRLLLVVLLLMMM